MARRLVTSARPAILRTWVPRGVGRAKQAHIAEAERLASHVKQVSSPQGRPPLHALDAPPVNRPSLLQTPPAASRARLVRPRRILSVSSARQALILRTPEVFSAPHVQQALHLPSQARPATALACLVPQEPFALGLDVVNAHLARLETSRLIVAAQYACNVRTGFGQRLRRGRTYASSSQSPRSVSTCRCIMM